MNLSSLSCMRYNLTCQGFAAFERTVFGSIVMKLENRPPSFLVRSTMRKHEKLLATVSGRVGRVGRVEWRVFAAAARAATSIKVSPFSVVARVVASSPIAVGAGDGTGIASRMFMDVDALSVCWCSLCRFAGDSSMRSELTSGPGVSSAGIVVSADTN